VDILTSRCRRPPIRLHQSRKAGARPTLPEQIRHYRALVAADLEGLEARLDDLTIPLLGPLRTSKTLDGTVMEDLLQLGDELGETLSGRATVPTALVGKALFVFTAMLAEADHARSPEPILDAAWQWQEKLQRAFGPKFDRP
jgi:hypothetical protein